MANAGELSFRTVRTAGSRSSRRTTRARCSSTRRSAVPLGIPYVWDPGQQCARMSGVELKDGLVGAAIVICNDYEFELIRQKTGLDETAILEHTQALVITRGEAGCSIVERDRRTDVPAVPPTRLVDPTGVGDAFRGGFLKGMARGADYEVCARLGSVAATYALEHLGGQSHAYTWPEFRERYEAHFDSSHGIE
jgi:adenosine kinase